MRLMLTIALASQKGGTAKTTSAVNLAAALVLTGSRVLLCDLDAQASATLWLTDNYGPKGRTVRDVLKRDAKIQECIVHTRPGIDLLPANLWLSSLGIEMLSAYRKEERLGSALDTVAAQYDFCLIDCPPSLELATVNAFTACRTCVIPIDCRAQALLCVPQLLEVLVGISTEFGEPIGVYALPTFFERTNLARDIVSQIEEQFEAATLPPIHKNTRLAEAFVSRQTIFEYDSTALGAVDYKRVARELYDDLTPTTRLRRRTEEAG